MARPRFACSGKTGLKALENWIRPCRKREFAEFNGGSEKRAKRVGTPIYLFIGSRRAGIQIYNTFLPAVCYSESGGMFGMRGWEPFLRSLHSWHMLKVNNFSVWDGGRSSFGKIFTFWVFTFP